MRLRFLTTYNFTPIAERRETTKYLLGMEATVKREDGELAVARGAAIEIEVEPRIDEPAPLKTKRKAPA